MIVTPERVVYAGLCGSPRGRTLGSLAIYVSLGSPFQVRTSGAEWRTTHFAVIAPYELHDVVSSERIFCSLHIEPESVEVATLQALLARDGDEVAGAAAREAFRALIGGAATFDASTEEVDRAFLGAALPRRAMDPRISRAVAAMQERPNDMTGAAGYARLAGISPSRFLHLFTDEIGASFRAFRAWKRARSFLALVRADLNLTDIAMETGYSDSSHFSHSIRKIYGLRPKDILAGSRRLTVIRPPDVSARHSGAVYAHGR